MKSICLQVGVVCEDYVKNVSFKETIAKLSISRALYYRIIRNAKNGVYCGFIYYQNKIKDSNNEVVRVEEVRYKGKHDMIVSKEVYLKLLEKYKKQISKENYRVLFKKYG